MNARKEDSKNSLDTDLAYQPSDRVTELERKVAKLQEDVRMLKRLSAWPYWGDEANEADEKKKPGPKERISDGELLHYRDALILWLEPVWPWMIDRLAAAGTVDEVEVILEAVARDPDYRAYWQSRMLQNAAALFKFSRDARFRKMLPKATVTDALTLPWEDERRKRAANQLPTRQIANAMAGVPDIAWRTLARPLQRAALGGVRCAESGHVLPGAAEYSRAQRSGPYGNVVPCAEIRRNGFSSPQRRNPARGRAPGRLEATGTKILEPSIAALG